VWLKLGCSPAPLLLGFVLGPMMEENLRRALVVSRGDPTVFVTRPISLGFIVATALILILVTAPAVRARRGGVAGGRRPAAASGSPRFDSDEGDIHETYAAGRALSPAQAAFWTAVLREELADLPVRRTVDLGCGVGRFSRLLRDALGGRVHGVDRSAKMLAVAP